MPFARADLSSVSSRVLQLLQSQRRHGSDAPTGPSGDDRDHRDDGDDSFADASPLATTYVPVTICGRVYDGVVCCGVGGVCRGRLAPLRPTHMAGFVLCWGSSRL